MALSLLFHIFADSVWCRLSLGGGENQVPYVAGFPGTSCMLLIWAESEEHSEHAPHHWLRTRTGDLIVTVAVLYIHLWTTTPWVKKKQDTNSCPQLPQMLTDLQNSFTDRLSGKFATNSYLNIPPHPKCVATLPCEISMFKNRHTQEVIEANCHVRLIHSKNCF